MNWVLKPLTERERDVLRLRSEKKLLREIGEMFGITKERVRQIKAHALEKVYVQEARSKGGPL